MADDVSSDEERNAMLRSVAIDSHAVLQAASASSAPASSRKSRSAKSSKRKVCKDDDDNSDDDDGDDSNGLKFYQIRVQDLLHKHLDKVLEETPVVVGVEFKGGTESSVVSEEEIYDGETRLFKNAPAGITVKRPSSSKDSCPKVRVLPARYESSDEDSTEYHSRLQAVAVDGTKIKLQAEKSQAQAHAKFLADEAAAQRTDKVDKQRVARLRKERGEEWLPSVAKEKMKEIREETEQRRAISSRGKIGVVK